MPPIGRRAPGGPGLAIMGSLTLVGLLYACAEYARQAWWVPSPPGVPGDSHGDPLAFVALALTTVTFPGALAWLVMRRWRWVPTVLRWVVALTIALLPTTLLALDRLFEIVRWPWSLVQIGGPPYYLRLLLCGLALLTVPVWVMAFWRPLQGLPRILARLLLLPTMVAPVVLIFLLRSEVVSSGRGPVPSPDAPCVVLITIDTLRQDALAPYGGEVALPEALADARVFDGWSSSSWTLPAMASLFTALAPTGHGADAQHMPTSEVRTWTQAVQDAGWTTAAVASNPFLRRRFGFERGFDHFEHAEELGFLEPIARTLWAEWWTRRVVDRQDPSRGDRLARRAQRWLAQSTKDRPFLLWVHLIDPHMPYELRGHGGALRPDVVPDWIEPIEGLLGVHGFEDLVGARDGVVVTSALERDALRRLYRTEVDFSLHWAGEIVRAAREAAGSRALLWVLSSDHGEEFWDHGGFEHGHGFDDSVIRVPMLVGGAPASEVAARAGDRIRLTDVGPLVLRALGIEGFDPRSTSGLLDEVGPLDAYGVGGVPGTAGEVPLLVEGILYGPARTLLVDPSGRSAERDDATRAIDFGRRWTDASDSLSIEAVQDLFLQIDLWRERTSSRKTEIEIDPDLERRLRAVGYLR